MLVLIDGHTSVETDPMLYYSIRQQNHNASRSGGIRTAIEAGEWKAMLCQRKGNGQE